MTTQLWVSQGCNKILSGMTVNKTEGNWPPQKFCSDLVLPGTTSKQDTQRVPKPGCLYSSSKLSFGNGAVLVIQNMIAIAATEAGDKWDGAHQY